MKRARKVTGWAFLALLTLQAACGGALAGLGRVDEAKPGSSAGFNLFSPEQDIELGAASAEEIRRQLVVVSDERAGRYVQRLGERLAAQAPGYRFPYKFVVVASPEVNAFALPGGYVFVNEGAVRAARTEGELAGVLAHEIAHVSLRHGTTQASRAYLARTGLNVLGALSVALQGDLGRLATVVGGAGANKLFLKSNREAEAQADAEGVRLMAAAGYDPREMAEFFERLDERGVGGREEPGDHPDPASRVEAIGRVVAELKAAPARAQDSEEFRRVRSRLSGR
ncbi:MAG TPA: M48 family metallopeptidase [Pyrinomonadaceae bacterium]